MKDEIILEERLRAAASHFEAMAAETEPEISIKDVAPEVAALLREAADAYHSEREFRESWERASETFKSLRPRRPPDPVT
jgi:hypothetical protein